MGEGITARRPAAACALPLEQGAGMIEAPGRGEVDLMGLALRLARRGRHATSPNPMVGAVVVSRGQVVGSGYHRRAGAPHAEVVALATAGAQARGATLWVTLEPCSTEGRTGPCTDRILAAGVAEVRVATLDPNPRHHGRGVRALRARGVRVAVGERGSEARELIEHFACWITTGRPFVTLKLAMTLDGRVATRSGEARWITSPQARAWGHRLRASHDAVLVGSGTVLADDPVLSARVGRRPRQPLRVVLDRRLRVSPGARLLGEGSSSVLIFSGPDPVPARRRALEAAGAEVVQLPGDGDRLGAALDELGRRQVTSVLIEGGPTVMGSALVEGLGNRLVAFVAPLLVGGEAARGAIGGAGFERLAEARRLRRLRAEPVGPDLCLMGEL